MLPLLFLAACSNTNRGVTGTVGVGNGVALLTAGDVTQLLQGQTLVVTAAVTNDPNNEGVVWSLQPNNGSAGSLTNITATTATFVAPVSGVVGEVSATITATAKVNAIYNSAVTLITAGSAVGNQVTLFPANVNVAYATSLTVSGGTQPFAWELAPGSGPLPPGITLLGSTSGLDSISGVPTATGTYSFVVQATDSSAPAVTVTFPVTLTVAAQDTCVLGTGTFALMASGFRGGGGMTHVATITINNNGVITGEQDYKDGHRTTVDEQITSLSACTNRETNSGQIQLESASGALLYNLSATPPDSNNVIQSARLQLIGSGSDSASGLLQRVDTGAITATAPTGNFAFGLLGVQEQEPQSVHFAMAGRFTSDASGTITGGLIDSNNPTPLTAAPLSGTLSAPDAQGRGTANFTFGGATFPYVYYVVSASKIYLMDVSPQTSISPRLNGFMTPQVGDAGSGDTFDANAFSATTASVLSLWGAISGPEPITSQTMGLLSGAMSGANGTTTLTAVLDVTDQNNNLLTQTYQGSVYNVAPNGRGTVTFTSVGQLTYELVFYLDGINDGYVVEQKAPDGSGGLLEAQFAMPAGGFPVTFPGSFVGGTQFAMAPGPITLNPLAALNFGSLSSNFTNAQFDIDNTTGRGLGTLTQTGVGVQPAVIYEVSPTKLEVLRFSTRAVDGNIDWLIQDVD